MTIYYSVITSILSGLLLILKIVITSQPQALLVAEKMWQMIDIKSQKKKIKKKNEEPTKMRFHNYPISS
jgi:hypothetical protein